MQINGLGPGRPIKRSSNRIPATTAISSEPHRHHSPPEKPVPKLESDHTSQTEHVYEGETERMPFNAYGLKAVSQYTEHSTLEQKETLSRLMGIDVFA